MDTDGLLFLFLFPAPFLVCKLAKREGVSVEEVLREMDKAIEVAYENRKENKLWMESFGDEKPTTEQFLKWLTTKVKRGLLIEK